MQEGKKKAKAAKPAGIYFDETAQRWRDYSTGRFVSGPSPPQESAAVRKSEKLQQEASAVPLIGAILIAFLMFLLKSVLLLDD